MAAIAGVWPGGKGRLCLRFPAGKLTLVQTPLGMLVVEDFPLERAKCPRFRPGFRPLAAPLTLILLAGAALSACATPQPKYAAWTPGIGQAAQPSGAGGRYKVGDPYQVAGIWYVPKEQPNYDETGTASWYGDAFNNKSTANGEIFDMHAISAAHPTLPMPSIGGSHQSGQLAGSCRCGSMTGARCGRAPDRPVPGRRTRAGL